MKIGGKGFNVPSPSRSNGNDFIFGCSSPINVNSYQCNNKNINFSISLDSNPFNSDLTNNPLSSLRSPYNFWQNNFQSNLEKEELTELLINPLSDLTCAPTTTLAQNFIPTLENTCNEYNSVFNDNNSACIPKSELPLLNMEVINKADTYKFFCEGVLSCCESPTSTNEITRPFLTFNSRNSEDFYEVSTKDVSRLGSAQKE